MGQRARAHIEARYEFCEDMAQMLVDPARTKLFELGVTEQDVLDAGQPSDLDAKDFFSMVNDLHHVQDHIVLCICNSGRRSLTAASLLRSRARP